MVTKYQIPCSSCGKIVERYIFCSGACKVKGSRERKTNKEITKKLEPNVIPETPHLVTIKKKDIDGEMDLKVDLKGVSPVEETISDVPKEGYHFVSYLGKYVKD